jgi:hypothetical protein
LSVQDEAERDVLAEIVTHFQQIRESAFHTLEKGEQLKYS